MKNLIELLVCPKCRGPLLEADGGFCCENCELVYPIDDGIPVMLVDHAVPLADWQKKAEKSCECS